MVKFGWSQQMLIMGLLFAVMMLAACSGSGSPTADNSAPTVMAPTTAPDPAASSAPTRAAAASPTSAPASSGSSGPGQIVITGTVNKSFTPIGVEALHVNDRIIINLKERTVGGITLSFPVDTQPGTYPINDHLNQPVVDIFGEYDVFGNNSAFYLSTKGTLTLTAVGSSFSGTFQFSAGWNKDGTKTIEASGSFANVPMSSN